MIRRASAVLASTLVLLVAVACDQGTNCNDATVAMEQSISTVCSEPEFVDSPFCRCCVPNGYYSIDDTCTCQPLVLNTDFCWYDGTEAGYPSVRNALSYAASVCENRGINVPYADVNTAACPTPEVPSPPPDASTDTGESAEGGE